MSQVDEDTPKDYVFKTLEEYVTAEMENLTLTQKIRFYLEDNIWWVLATVNTLGYLAGAKFGLPTITL